MIKLKWANKNLPIGNMTAGKCIDSKIEMIRPKIHTVLRKRQLPWPQQADYFE